MATLAIPNDALSKLNVGTPLMVVMILAMMMLPLPPLILDVLFTFNITLSLVVLLASVYTTRPLNFSVFPTLLLLTTLLRLSLNVASTRVVLLHGQNGPAAAGQVIKSFGEVVIGGNYAVGLVVFSILVIINFVVVTKGAGRVSEVSARFTLDAMPGKQIAIDADLNAGIIDADEAKKRRADVTSEADFYGSMDGASKFVRGDAVAGILILFINIIGGLIIGIVQHSLSVGDALHIYALLTIGDGLVAQIPSLLLSTAAAIMVTRVNSSQNISEQALSQLFSNPTVLLITGGIIGLLGIIPGMPHLAFITLGGVAIGGAYMLYTKETLDKEKKSTDKKPKTQNGEQEKVRRELSWEDVASVDMIGLEIGYRLIKLVDDKQNGQLMERIKGIRKKISSELGFLVPSVHIRDNLDISASDFRVSVMGVNYAQSEVQIDKLLAINPGNVFGNIDGKPTKDPTYGLEAVWINPDQKDYAQSIGYTVVDPSTVIATQLSHIIQTNAHQLLGHEEVQQLLDQLAQTAPKLVEALTPAALPLSTIVKVLQGLLEDKVSLIDMRTIAETLIEAAKQNTETTSLIGAARQGLKRLICQNLFGQKQDIDVCTIAPELEQILIQSINANGQIEGAIEPSLTQKIIQEALNFDEKMTAIGDKAILLTAPPLRALLARFMRYTVPGLSVLSIDEIPDEKRLKVSHVIGHQ